MTPSCEASFEVPGTPHPLSKTEMGTPALPMFAGRGGVALALKAPRKNYC